MKTTTTLAVLASLGLAATSANAAYVVTNVQGTPTHAVQGTLLAIDGPQSAQGGNITGPQGPNWAENADDGWELLGGTIFKETGRSGWEPDGTDDSLAWTGYFNSAASGNQARWTFDVPDGTIIHNVYATWYSQSNSGEGHTFSYNEGALTSFVRAKANSVNNLQLQWTAADNDPHNINFERIFAGDITVAGNDGFAVTFDAALGFANIDAVVIDYTAIPEPTTTALLGLGGLALILRRRK